MPAIRIVSVYVDQRVRQAEAQPSDFVKAMTGELDAPWLKPKPGVPDDGGTGREPLVRHTGARGEAASNSDLSALRAEQFGFRLCTGIPEALRCGGRQVAVDAVLAIVEQDDYPLSHLGQPLLPQFDFFEQCVQVFDTDGQAVPYFNFNQLAFSFADAQHMVSAGERLGFPLLGGGSMALTWRLPDVDVPYGAQVYEGVMAGVGGLNDTAFAALDALQAMMERRHGGETGVRAVQLLEGDDVWIAAASGRWSTDLLSSALSRSDTPLGLTWLDGRTQDLSAPETLRQLVKAPAACCIEYIDGARATLLFLNGALRDFNIAVALKDGRRVSTQFFLSPPPNETHSACLAAAMEQFFLTKRAPYPPQRALLTTGIVDACFQSRHRLNERVETPHLQIPYVVSPEPSYART